MKHELTGRLTNFSISYKTGNPILTFEIEEKQSALNMAEDLLNCGKLAIKVSEFKKKRSLDANAYAWVLIGKIAEKTSVAKHDVYRAAIREIGGNSDTVCIQNHAVEQLCAGWHRNGI